MIEGVLGALLLSPAYQYVVYDTGLCGSPVQSQ